MLYLCGIKLINPHCWFLQMLFVLYACFFIFRKLDTNILVAGLIIGGGFYIILTHEVGDIMIALLKKTNCKCISKVC